MKQLACQSQHLLLGSQQLMLHGRVEIDALRVVVGQHVREMHQGLLSVEEKSGCITVYKIILVVVYMLLVSQLLQLVRGE